MSSLERAVEYAEYLVELARKNPSALLTTPTNSIPPGRKSIHQKLLELYIEESGRQGDDKKLLCNTRLLPKLVHRDKLNCLILNLYPGNEGYSLMLKSKTGVETETVKLPYEVTELLEYIDDSQLPPFLVDILEKAQVNVFYSGCVIVEVRDYRRSATGSYDTQYVLLRPTPQSLMCDINNITNDGNVWTQEDIHQLESRLLLATEEPLCLDPSPAVLLVANRQQFDRKKFNTPGMKRCIKKFSQAAVNRKRKFAQGPAPSELKLHDFITRKRDKKIAATPVNLKLGKSCVDSWKQRPVTLAAPELVEVEKFARALEKPEPKLLRDNSLLLIEEHTLERDVTQEKKLLAKLSIYNRPGDDAHLGELYLDHDFMENKSQGATCKFMLGNADSVKKYLNQFKEIFTEEGRRAVKITTQRPGQPPIVTCTQATPPGTRHEPPSSTPGPAKPSHTAGTTVSTPSSDSLATGSQSALAAGQKRSLPLQLSLPVNPGASQSMVTPPTPNTQGLTASQVQFNIQQPNQSQIASQRLQQGGLQQGGNQSQSASQRLKQLGIHTSIGSRNNTPTASPVNAQAPVAQLFGSPPPQQATPPVLQPQTSVTRTPSNTPTPTPPPQILSPPVIPVVTAARKTLALPESSTVHHLAQTPHHANVATYIQGQGETTHTSTTPHPQSGVANINIANITGIPPNINIQNLTGLPGMNIANLPGLQSMQVSLSVPGGSIAVPVPITMISTNPVIQNQAGVIVSGGSVGGAQQSQLSSSAPTSIVTMVTPLPSATISSTQASSTSQVVTGVLTNTSTVINAPTGMLSLPLGLSGNITQLVPAGIKSHGQLRASTSMPVFQLGQQGIQLVNFPQRAPLKASATLQPGQTVGQLSAGAKPGGSNPGSVTTAILANPALGGQPVLSQISVNQKPQGGVPTTLTHTALLQLPQFQAQIQSFQKQGQQPLQFHPIIRQPIPTQQLQTFGGKPKSKKRTTPTPPKQ